MPLICITHHILGWHLAPNTPCLAPSKAVLSRKLYIKQFENLNCRLCLHEEPANRECKAAVQNKSATQLKLRHQVFLGKLCFYGLVVKQKKKAFWIYEPLFFHPRALNDF